MTAVEARSFAVEPQCLCPVVTEAVVSGTARSRELKASGQCPEGRPHPGSQVKTTTVLAPFSHRDMKRLVSSDVCTIRSGIGDTQKSFSVRAL